MVASYASCNKFYGKMSVGFYLNTEKRISLEVLFDWQQKDLKFVLKTVLGIFKLIHRIRDRHIFMWQSLGILNIFNSLTLN